MNPSHPITLCILFLCPIWLHATRLVSLQPLDNQNLVLHFQDGMVEYNWDKTEGSCNGWDPYHTEKWSLCEDKDQYIPFGNPLDTEAAQQESRYRLRSYRDRQYNGDGTFTRSISRKSKVWEAAFDEMMPVMHHWIYLELKSPMVRGATYMLEIDDALQSDRQQVVFTFEEKQLISPAIKISNIGYEASAPHKCADVYAWKGDGGEHDFSRLTGAPFHLVDTDSGAIAYTGELKFHMENKPEPYYEVDLTGADVWDCDFSDFSEPGTYRLVIEGIGSSHPFIIGHNRFQEAFKTSMQGMFYQRMGCDEAPAGGFPMARRPLFKQGVEPENFVVYISEHDMVTGPNPDNRGHYSSALTGEIAQQTWGGWSDAYDNDQRPVNFICVFDLLLTYYLNPEAFTDNQLYVPETDNGIPDIIDEALWQIDWWLRMRDAAGGYLTGLTNITDHKENYAGAPVAWQGWCVAAATAMVADCFRIAGNFEMQQQYLAESLEAWGWAESQEDHMLDTAVQGLRGRDLKMTAAAFLFNLTGDYAYEEILAQESIATTNTSSLLQLDEKDQRFASVGYLLSERKINYGELHERMKASFIHQAKTDYLAKTPHSPTKAVRHTGKWEGMLQTSNEMSVVAIAHRLTDNPVEARTFAKALYTEAEWTLGRNPLGLVQMTGLTERSFTQTFAPGRRDGAPGLTPGWTPYMCRDGWMDGDHIVKCGWYTSRAYPRDKEAWAWGEQFWNTRYNVPSGEATPQQTFRQKIVLYGYLYALNHES